MQGDCVGLVLCRQGGAEVCLDYLEETGMVRLVDAYVRF